MKTYSWILTIALSAIVIGCSSSNDDDALLQGNTDPAFILDRVWLLSAVQDNTGNQTLVFQEPRFEFIIEFTSDIRTFMFQGEQPVVRGINACNLFLGPYSLIDGLLTIGGLSQDEDDCLRPLDPIRSVVDNVLIFANDNLMVSTNPEGNMLTIASGTNAVLFFDASNDPFPTF